MAAACLTGGAVQTSLTKKRRLSSAFLPVPQRRKQAGSRDLIAPSPSAVPTIEKTSLTSTMATAHHREDTLVAIYNLTDTERQMLYKSFFIKDVEPITHIAAPEESYDYPDFAQEIQDAYLRYTTFTVKVWINYDAVAKRFYTCSDPRSNDAGKLQLSRAQRDDLQRLSTFRGFKLNKIQFEIGTPFTNLAYFFVRCIPAKEASQKPIIKASVRKYGIDEYPEVTDFLENVADNLYQVDLDYGQEGFKLEDLDLLATFFPRTQQPFEAREYEDNPLDSGWTDFKREEKRLCKRCWYAERNDSFVDFEEMEKARETDSERANRARYHESIGAKSGSLGG